MVQGITLYPSTKNTQNLNYYQNINYQQFMKHKHTEAYRANIYLSDEAPILPNIGISTSHLVSIEELKPHEPKPKKHAIISDCKKYRFALHREWDDSKPTAMFIMLNPSTADAEKDDPTIRRCMSFAKSWGYGGIIVCNLFPFRATNPKELLIRENISTQISLNGSYIRQLQEHCRVVILAWGNELILDYIFKQHYPFGKLNYLQIEKIHYLELSKNGTPKHPLYLPQTLKPQPLRELTNSIKRILM